MRVKTDDDQWGQAELVVYQLDIQKCFQTDYFELAWKIKPLLGHKELISLYINNLYLLIFENVGKDGGFEYRVGRRYITKHPILSDVLWMTTMEPDIWENGANEYIQQFVPKLMEWVKELVESRRQQI